MIAPASVPQVMTVESCHHRVGPAADLRDQPVGRCVGDDHRHDRRQPHQAGQRRLEIHRRGVGKARLRPRGVQQVGHAAREDHHDAHDEDPDEELDLHRGLGHRDEDEGDERDAGDAIGLEAVGARADRVARVVTRAVGNDAWVPHVVFFDVEDDLHQVGADVRNLREDAAGDPEGRRAKRLANRETNEARPGVVARNEQQDAQHQQELDADQQHPDAHAGAERNGVNGIRHALETGERRPRVRERVHPDAEPGDAVAAADPDQTEEQNDHDLHRVHVLEHAKVKHHDHADEELEDQDELALRDQVGLARLVNQLRRRRASTCAPAGSSTA